MKDDLTLVPLSSSSAKPSKSEHTPSIKPYTAIVETVNGFTLKKRTKALFLGDREMIDRQQKTISSRTKKSLGSNELAEYRTAKKLWTYPYALIIPPST